LPRPIATDRMSVEQHPAAAQSNRLAKRKLRPMVILTAVISLIVIGTFCWSFVASVIWAIQVTSSCGQMQQLGMSVQNYHDVRNVLPGHCSYDKDGKPLLSWRVHLLPFFEGGDLYERFHLDEPWGSPHNRELIPGPICPQA
jgi:hypothetical protein